MEKTELTIKLSRWLKDYIKRNLLDTFDLVDIFIPESNLSKINHSVLKLSENYSAWDFKPDVMAILKNKQTSAHCFIIMNRSINAISLKEIGEINCYAKLTNSEMAFLVSPRGISSEVSVLLLEKNIQDRLLQYNPGKFISIFSWDEDKDGVLQNSIFPFSTKSDYLFQ